VNIKNVLIVDEGTGFGGSLIVAARLASALDKTQFNPIIVTAMDINIARSHIDRDIEVIALSKTFTYVDREKLTNKLSKLKSRLLFKLSMLLLTFYETLVNIHYPATIARLIFSKKIDIVHINNSNDALIAGRLTGTKCIQHLHGWQNPPDSYSAQFYYRLPHAFIAISNIVKDVIVNAGADENKMTVIHNPIANISPLSHSDIEALNNELGINNELLTISIFGRIIEWKGQYQFLQALKLLKDQGYFYNVLIVGDDGEGRNKDYLNTVIEYADTHLSEYTVIFSGHVGSPEKLYQVSDIVVHASIEPEPFGLVITEAMQNGAATIASKYGAGPEIIQDNVTGLICDPKNPKDTADKIKQLLDNQKLRENLAAKGKEKVTTTLTPHMFANKVAKIYSRL